MVEDGHREERRGNGSTAELARQGERIVSLQSEQSVLLDRVAALEEYAAARARGAGLREWITPVATAFAAIAFIFGLGIGPVDDKVEAEITNRKDSLINSTSDIKQDIDASNAFQLERIERLDQASIDRDNAQRDLMDERDRRYTEAIDRAYKDVEYLDDKIDALEADTNRKIDNLRKAQ